MSVPPPPPIDRQVQALSDQELDEKMKSLKDKQGCVAFVCGVLFFLTGLAIFLVVAIIHPFALPPDSSDLIGCIGFNGLIFLTVLVFLGSGDWAYESQLLPLRVEKSQRESDARVRQWREEQARQAQRRTTLPISGPPQFEQAVYRVLNELKANAPHRYQEVLEYLPKAEYDASLGGWSYSDGRFGIDGSNYGSFRWVFLHEVGHNVRGEQWNNWSEEAASTYANQVCTELDR